MFEICILAIVIGGFVHHMIAPKSDLSVRLQQEREGFEELNNKINRFQEELELMCYDPCSICGQVSKFASKCEKSHLDEIERSRVQEGLRAFRAQEEWVNG